jgi:hypothetical protein
MPTPFVASLDAEISRLESVIEVLPEVRQLNELRRVRALYSGPSEPMIAGSMIANDAQDSAHFVLTSRPGRKMSSERQQALEFAEVHMTGQTLPTKTADLLSALRANGIEIGGNDPVNSLSALLSTSGKFIAHGRSGWTLKPSNGGSQVSAPVLAGGNPGAGAPGPINQEQMPAEWRTGGGT